MDLVKQLMANGFGSVTLLKSRGLCSAQNFTSIVTPKSMCLLNESPSWKYLHSLLENFPQIYEELWAIVSLAFDYCSHIYGGLAGITRHLHSIGTQLQEYSDIFAQDQLCMFTLKFLCLLIFLFFMHWLKVNHVFSTTQRPQMNGMAIPWRDNTDDATIINSLPQTVICEFEFQNHREGTKNMVAPQILLEITSEEKQHDKRNTIAKKKRNCVSAGPVLVHMRSPKRKRPPLRGILPTLILRNVEAHKDNDYLPIRSKPLFVAPKCKVSGPAIQAKLNFKNVKKTDAIAYMCVYKFAKNLFS